MPKKKYFYSTKLSPIETDGLPPEVGGQWGRTRDEGGLACPAQEDDDRLQERNLRVLQPGQNQNKG